MWSVLEEVPGLTTLARIWRNLLGEDFGRMSPFLRPLEHLATRAPCGRCCCSHRIVPRGESFIAICECETFTCADIPLVREDVVILEFDTARLGRSVIRALGCEPREQALECQDARQIGVFGASALPIILAVPHDPAAFLAVVTQLAARLGGPFALLAPTMRFVDVRALDLLNSRRAGVFGLDSLVILDGDGRVRTRSTAAELFSRFVTAEVPGDSTAAGEALSLIEKLESEKPVKAPSVISVFRMYCVDNLTADQIATRCHCSKGTVVNRLNTIRRVTGLAPEALRRASQHLERPRDSRARSQYLDVKG